MYRLMRLYFDIETQANPENLALMPEPKAPGNLKDPVKIAAAIAEKKADLIESAALDPDYGKVLSIGMSKGPGMAVVVTAVGDIVPGKPTMSPSGDDVIEWGEDYTITEEDIIETFWTNFADCRGNCVGFNILGFDLPYLMRRSMALGIRIPFLPALAKFRTEPVTDLYAILYNWGPGKGLKTIANLYGIHNDCPDVDGSKVKDLDRETLRAYQASDVKLVIDLYQKMNGVYFHHSV